MDIRYITDVHVESAICGSLDILNITDVPVDQRMSADIRSTDIRIDIRMDVGATNIREYEVYCGYP